MPPPDWLPDRSICFAVLCWKMEDGDWREAFQARPSSRPDDDDLPVVSTFFLLLSKRSEGVEEECTSFSSLPKLGS